MSLLLALCIGLPPQSPASFGSEFQLSTHLARQTTGAADPHYQTTPDGQQVVFLLDPANGAGLDLCISAADGSTSETVLFSGFDTLQAGMPVFEFDPAEPRLAFAHVLGQPGIWVTDLDGGTPPALIAPTSGDVLRFQFTPDGSAIYFLENVGTFFDPFGVWHVVPTDGSAPARPLSDPAFDASSPSPVLTPDGTTLVFRQRTGAAQLNHLFAARLDTVSLIDLTAGLGQVLVPKMRTTPDSQAVVVQMRGPTDRRDLYRLPIDGSGPPELLNPPLQQGRNITRWELNADATFVVYRSDIDVDDTFQLSSVPLDGSQQAVLLHPPIVSGGGISTFVLSPDGRRTVFTADADVAGLEEVYAAPIDGSGRAIKLSGALTGAADASEAEVSADSNWVLYLADANQDETQELFTVPMDGSLSPRSISGSVATSGAGVTQFRLAGGGRALFLVDNLGDGLWSSSLDAVGLPQRVDDNPIGEGSVHDFAPTATGDRVMYRDRLYSESARELRIAPADGSLASFRPYDALASREIGDVAEVRMLPDDRTVVYTAEDVEVGQSRLFAQRIDRGAPVTVLAPLLAPDASVERIELSNDGSTVVFEVVSLDPSAAGVFRVLADGSQLPVRLTQVQAPAYRIEQWELVGEHVYYTSRLSLSAGVELRRVPWQGSPQSTRLHLPLPSSSEVTSFQVASDESRVAFLGDLLIDDEIELWAVNPAFPNQAQLLLPPFTFPLTKLEYVLSPDGSAVAFVADMAAFFKFDAYAVPCDGSSDPVRLHSPVIGNQDAFGVTFTRDSARVVFWGDLVTEDRTELYSARPDGTDARDLSAPAVHAGSVWQVDTAVGGLVVYRVSHIGTSTDLFRVPADGSAIPESLVQQYGLSFAFRFVLTPDGERALFTWRPPSGNRRHLYSVDVTDNVGPVVHFEATDPLVGLSELRTDSFRYDARGRVYFVVNENEDGQNAYRASLTSARPAERISPIVDGDAITRLPVPSSDGARFVYTRSTPGVLSLPLFAVERRNQQLPY